MMHISTLDPITMQDVTHTDRSPYVIEGHGANAMKIYFENEANKAEYLDINLHSPNATVPAANARVARSDNTGTIS